MFKFIVRSVIIAASIFASSYAVASEIYKIDIENGMVSHMRMNVKVGDTIEIHHKDDLPGKHDLYTIDPAHKFDLTGMKKGDIFSVKLKQPGSFDILCHSMPKMKIKITVTK